MCLALIYHDRTAAFPLRVFETRDENIYRAHGSRALRLLRGVESPSFAAHWPDPESLEGLFLVHEPRDVVRALPLGGFDRFNGTWVAIGQETGVYARLLIAVFRDGTFAESPTPELMQRRLSEGYAKRGGRCLDAVAFPSARLAAQELPERTRFALVRHGQKLLPHFLLIADAKDAFILHFVEDGATRVIEVPQRELTMLSIRGINAPDSGMTSQLIEPLRRAELPDPARANGWDGWLKVASIEENFSDFTARPGAIPYLDPEWRSHRYSILQPAYLNVSGPRGHTRAVFGALEAGDVVEWTTASTCMAADAAGCMVLLINERQLEEKAPFALTIEGASFPRATLDYTAVPLLNGFGPSAVNHVALKAS